MPEFKYADESEVKVAQLMTLEWANIFGNVHGGHVLHLVDNIAYVCAARYSGMACATARSAIASSNSSRRWTTPRWTPSSLAPSHHRRPGGPTQSTAARTAHLNPCPDSGRSAHFPLPAAAPRSAFAAWSAASPGTL